MKELSEKRETCTIVSGITQDIIQVDCFPKTFFDKSLQVPHKNNTYAFFYLILNSFFCTSLFASFLKWMFFTCWPKSCEMWQYFAEGIALIQHELLRVIHLDHESQTKSSLSILVEEWPSYSLSNSEVSLRLEVFTQFGGSKLRGICMGSKSAGFHPFGGYTQFRTVQVSQRSMWKYLSQ
jgi:hypothetical protein